MNVIHITPYFKEYVGGQEKFVENLCRELSLMGFDISILTSSLSNKNTLEVDNNIRIIRHRTPIRIMRSPITPGIVKSILRNSNVSIIHAHNMYHFPTLALYLAKLISQRLTSRLLLHEHGILNLGSKLYDSFLRIYENTALRKMIRLSDAVIFLSKFSMKSLIERTKLNFSEQNIYILPNAINMRDYLWKAKNVDETLALRILREKRLQDYISGELRLLFVGPVIRRKGVDTALNAMNILVNKYNEKSVKLIIIGSGDELSTVMRYIKRYGLRNNVYTIGLVSEELLISFYQFSDLVILPSRAEGVPTTIIEALALGKPVIASSIPSIKEYFHDFVEFTPIDDPIILALKLREFLRSSRNRATMQIKALNAVPYVREKFDIRKIAKEVAKLYEKLG